MTDVTGAEYDHKRLRSQSELDVSPLRLTGCTFNACSVAPRSEATEYLRVEDVALDTCRVVGGGLRGVWLVRCSATDLRLSGTVRLLGCVFEQTTIAGRLRQLIIHDTFSFLHEAERFRRIADEHYTSTTTAALDISRLVCPDLDIRGVPSRLIRIDPERHFVIDRHAVADTTWRDLDYDGTTYGIAMGLLARSSWEDKVLTIPIGKREARSREVVAELRERGLVADHIQPGRSD